MIETPLEQAMAFIEGLTADPLLIGVNDIEMTLEDVQDQARIELESIKRKVAAYPPPTPISVAPVRWQRRSSGTLNLSVDGWVDVPEEDISSYRERGQEIRALYASPAPAEHVVGSDDWFSQVTSFLVTRGMLDASDEYDINDVMAALADNYETAPAEHVVGDAIDDVASAARSFMDLFVVDDQGLSVDHIDMMELTHRFVALGAALKIEGYGND